MAAAVASRSASASSPSLVKHLAAAAASSCVCPCRHSSTSTPRRARLLLQQDEHSTRERERQQPDASVLRIKWDDSLSRPPTTTPLANDTTQDWMSQFWSDVPTTTTLDSDLDRDLDQEFLRSIDHDPPRSDDKDDDEFAQLVVHIIEANRNNSDTNSPPPSTRPPTESVRIDKEGEQQREHAVASLSRTDPATTATTTTTTTESDTTTRRPRRRSRQARPALNAADRPSNFALSVLPPTLVRRTLPLSSTTPSSSTRSGIDDEAPPASQWLERSRAPVRSQEGAATRIDPYRPYPLVSSSSSSAAPHPHAHPHPHPHPHRHPHREPQPYHFPLASRNDWRLSSPARFTLRSPPSPNQSSKSPTLPLSSAKETCTLSSGRNRLVGVGPDAARVGKAWRVVREWEGWGWKSRVPEGSAGGKGEWKDADTYIERFQRLLDLSKTSDEQHYLASLARAGTPLERQGKGLTVTRASGTWLTSPSSGGGGGGGGHGSAAAGTVTAQRGNGEMMTMAEKKRTGRSSSTPSSKNAGGGGAGGGGKAIAEFRTEGGYEVTEEEGFKFESGMVLRITESVEDSSSGGDYSGPRPPPPSSLSSEITDKWYVQGTLLEVRRDKLVVAFDEVDWWPLDDPGESYQIDIGLDLSSYALQQDALDKLYYDPARQRERNMLETLAAQEEFVLASEEQSAAVAAAAAAGGGTRRQIREWTLQGTELREEIVPSSASSSSGAPSESSTTEGEESPPLLARPIESDLFRDNQLIHSWIERYRRDDPLVLPGDPDLGLNASQTKAIAMALGDRLSLIQGPPGTGKSQTIVSLIALLKLHFRVPHPILLAAPTHVSVDHLVSLLVRAGLNPLRCGKAHRVSPEARNWTIEKRQEEHPLWKATEAARLASEEARVKLQEYRDAVRGTKEATNSATIKKDAELTELFRKTWRTFIVREQKLYASLLATADVFCATAVGSGASKVLNMVDFPIVLLDEAAMCTEPVSLIPLMKGAQHATLIGDHKQLPAVVTSKEARRERLHTSLFERLLQSGTVNSTLLDTQYRMRPAISSFPNDSFYQGALRDASIVEERPPPLKSQFLLPQLPEALGPSSTVSAPRSTIERDGANSTSSPTVEGEPFPVSFVAHSSPESTYRQSLLNRGESDLLITIVGDLLSANPDLVASDIGIISPYYAQMRLVSNSFASGFASARLGELLGPDRAASVVDVEVNTVDGFQGREKRVVLLSTVRSNRGGWIGFLNDKRRLNVALTRARDALIVVGNEHTLRRAAARAAPLTVPPPPRTSQVLQALREEEDKEGGIFAAAAGDAAADPDADPRIWADFLDWCQERGIVQRLEGPPVPA